MAGSVRLPVVGSLMEACGRCGEGLPKGGSLREAFGRRAGALMTAKKCLSRFRPLWEGPRSLEPGGKLKVGGGRWEEEGGGRLQLQLHLQLQLKALGLWC